MSLADTTEKVAKVEPMDDDLWLVKLPNGAVRSMTVDAMDDAFQCGELSGSTPVQAPDGDGWTTLAIVAGLDDDATPVAPRVAGTESESLREREESDRDTAGALAQAAALAFDSSRDSRDSIEPPSSSNAPSLAPMVASIAPTSSTFALEGRDRGSSPPSALGIARSVADLDAELAIAEAYARAGKRRMAFTMGFVAVGVVVCGAAVSFISGNASAPPPVAAKAAEVLAPPPAVDPAAAFAKPTLTEEQKKRLADADKARAGKKGVGGPAGGGSGVAKEKTGKGEASPFHQGGDKFDPLNGSL